MVSLSRGSMLSRNARCFCGSGKKYKQCCSPFAARTNKPAKNYFDEGEPPVRYVICDAAGTSFFCDKDGRIIVFQARSDANAITKLDDFKDQEPGEINIAGVGATKWAHLQKTFPYCEPESLDAAIELVRARIEHQRRQLTESDDATAESDS